MILAVLVILLALPSWAQATTYYIDNLAGACSGNYSIANRNCSGSDGTSYANTTISSTAAVAGDIIYLRGGTYSTVLALGAKTGTSLAQLTIAGYPGDTRPIIKHSVANSH